MAESHRLEYRSNATRYENAENMAQTWPVYHPTRMPEPHDSDRIWDLYDPRRAPSPKVTTRHCSTVLRDAIAESTYERVSSWATKCRSHPYTPIQSARLENEYSYQPCAYD